MTEFTKIFALVTAIAACIAAAFGVVVVFYGSVAAIITFLCFVALIGTLACIAVIAESLSE